MGWDAEIEELKRRQSMALEMGGADKVARQHEFGKLTVRERIDGLLDKGSFREIGALAGASEYDADGNLTAFRPSNFVLGRGKIDGRKVVVGGDDFTVRGGAADASVGGKQGYAERMANEMRMPIIRLVDGTGGGGSVRTIDTAARTYIPEMRGWEVVVNNLATIPVVALALGSVAGLGAARVATSHYSLIVKGSAQMFVAGPPVVARVAREVTKEELGGSKIHTRNGAIDDEVDSEAEAFEKTRQFLSYLPSSVHELPPRGPQDDDPDRADEMLLSIIPRDRRKVYKMRDILNSVVDNGSFFEIGRYFGRSIITGFARLDGWPVAIMGGDPYHYGGSWTADASLKVRRFVDLAETFHLPIVHMVDNPGFLIGIQAEEAATIRHGATALAAIFQTTVPWCAIMVRKAFGVAGAGHRNGARFTYRYAWPSGDWGSLPLEGGIEAAYRADLDAADDRDALLKEIEDRMNKVRSPFRTAEAFLAEEIIDPRQTRSILCEFANDAVKTLEVGPTSAGFRP